MLILKSRRFNKCLIRAHSILMSMKIFNGRKSLKAPLEEELALEEKVDHHLLEILMKNLQNDRLRNITYYFTLIYHSD